MKHETGLPARSSRLARRWRWLLASSLVLISASSAPAALIGRLEARSVALKGGRQPFRLSFREESGELTQKVVMFRFYVTGKARFVGPPRKGTIAFGDGSPILSGQSEAGLFEMDIDTPEAEELMFLFEEDSHEGVLPIVRTILGDDVEGARSRLYGATLGGATQRWSVIEQPVEAGAERTGPRTWWSGAIRPSVDAALVSTPVSVPTRIRGSTFLRFAHRFGLEPPECLTAAAGHHGAVVEAENTPGNWITLTPEGGYTGNVETTCESDLKGQAAFVGSTGGAFRKDSFDLARLAGKRARLRWRLATSCDECGAGEGWMIDDVIVETTDLIMRIVDAADDSDADGATGDIEVARGTDPTAFDTDGDGLSDGAEDLTGIFVSLQKTGSDPTAPDSDGGGVLDGIEATLGSDPNRAAGEPRPVAFDLTLAAGGGRTWKLRGDGTAGEAASDPIDELFATTGGFSIGVKSDRFPRLPEAYAADVAGGDTSIVIGPASVGPLLVTRKILVSAAHGFIRFLDVVENASGKPQDLDLLLDSQFASSRWAEVESAAQDGVDGAGREAGTWYASDDEAHFNDRDPRDGMPVFLWRYSGAAARIEPSDVVLASGTARISFPLELEPGERKVILHFGAQSGDFAASKATADLLENGGSDVLRGISLDDEAEIVNMSLDGDGDGIPTFFELEHGLDPADPADAARDIDGDGLTNVEEYRHGTNPSSADTDGDGVSDARELNELKTDPTSADTDQDGIADGADPFPTFLLIAEFSGSAFSVPGLDAVLEVKVRNGTETFDGLVRFTLAVEGPPASFQGPVEGGEAVSGLGTGSVLVSVTGGSLRLRLHADSTGRRIVSLVDSERVGIVVPTSRLEDFESSDGGFTPFVQGPPVWQWGTPPAKPGAVSGTKVWGTGLSGAYPRGATAVLATPVFRLPDSRDPGIAFQHFLDAERFGEFAAVFLSVDGADPEIIAGPFGDTPNGYEEVAISLDSVADKALQFLFVFFSDDVEEGIGWFIDDFRFGTSPSSWTIDFLDPASDPDSDGIDSRTEVERGTDPTSPDTDSDGLVDGVETATGRFVNGADTGSSPTNPDSDGGGEVDGLEVAGGRDPNDPSDDQLPIEFGPPDFGLPFTDGGGTEWLGTVLGSADHNGGSFYLQLNALSSSGGDFLAFEGVLAFGRQSLVLKSEPDFFPPPQVTRNLFFSRSERLVRWADVFQNEEGKEAVARVTLQSGLTNVTGDAAIIETSSGDSTLDVADEWYVAAVGPGGAGPFLGEYIQSRRSILAPSAAGSSNGITSVVYTLPVPANGRAALCHFAVLAPTLAEVHAMLERIGRSDPAVLAGLSDDDAAVLVNYPIDSDQDGLPDAFERAHGLDPAAAADAAADADADGLSNLAEFLHGTDPQQTDTDGDGLRDGAEVAAGTDPLKTDTDGDGVVDGSDPLPLVRIVARLKELSLGVAGAPTLLEVHLELAGRGSVDAAGVDLSPVRLMVESFPEVEVTRVVRGERTAGAGASSVYRADKDWLILEVRSATPVQSTITVSGAAGLGPESFTGVLRLLDPDGDEDLDGLPNRFEIANGTDPQNADSDGDGIRDRFETGSGLVEIGLELGTFPWVDDSDGGGVKDRDEIQRGTDPFDASDDASRRSTPVRLTGASGSWDIVNSWSIVESPSPTRLDNGGILIVNGRTLAPLETVTAGDASPTVRLGPARHGSVDVSRVIYAHPTAPFLRFEEAFDNPGTAAVDVEAELRFDLAADAQSVLDSTSNGAAVPDGSSQWVLLRGGRTRFLHVFFGGAALRSISVEPSDLVREVFSFSVPPGERRSLLHFAAFAPDRATLTSLAEKLLDLRGGALDGAGPEALRGVVNLPALEPVLWDQTPAAGIGVAPGELWSIRGELITSGLEVRAGGAPVEQAAAFCDRIVLRAPATLGDLPVEVRASDGRPLHFGGTLRVEQPREYFDRGDADDNGKVDLGDALRILAYLFQGGAAPPCLDGADVDDTGTVDFGDAFILVQILFQGAQPGILSPGGAVPGRDPTPDALPCAR